MELIVQEQTGQRTSSTSQPKSSTYSMTDGVWLGGRMSSEAGTQIVNLLCRTRAAMKAVRDELKVDVRINQNLQQASQQALDNLVETLESEFAELQESCFEKLENGEDSQTFQDYLEEELSVDSRDSSQEQQESE